MSMDNGFLCSGRGAPAVALYNASRLFPRSSPPKSTPPKSNRCIVLSNSPPQHSIARTLDDSLTCAPGYPAPYGHASRTSFPAQRPLSTQPRPPPTTAARLRALVALHPFPLRGTGKPASSIRPRLGVVGDALPSNSPAPEGKMPNGTARQVQRIINGSRIPAPLMFQGRNGFGLGLGLSTSTSGPKTTLVQTSPARTGRPSFHGTVIHSPRPIFVSTTSRRHADPGPGIRGDGRKPEGLPINAPTADTVDAPQTIVSGTPPALMCTQTASPSDVSSESQHTTQSAAESAEGHFNPELKNINGSDNKFGDEEHPSDSEGNRMECGDEDVVLSPSFDVIQALADTNQKPDESTASEQSPTTPDSHKAPPLQKTKSKTTPAYAPSGNIPDLIQEVETLIGHPRVDREAVHVAHRDAGAHSETGSCSTGLPGITLASSS
ncbi:hypothetical protein JB92DRAFT_2836407 [Gautieria morchelliformis]|nr:hypothetical protein JB92DRAFT_2836407 [Gautieria morchelliformis]